jgi:multisubunit Na+/H+ antiporter MnhC subunit
MLLKGLLKREFFEYVSIVLFILRGYFSNVFKKHFFKVIDGMGIIDCGDFTFEFKGEKW